MSGRYIILIIVLCVVTFSLYADTGTLTGKIVYETTGEPIPGVNVFLEGTDFSMITDIDGEFRIENIPVGEYNLRVEFIGYQETLFENIRIDSRQTETLFIPLKFEPAGENIEVSRPIERKQRDMIPDEVKIIEPRIDPVEVIEEPVSEAVKIDMNISQYGTIVFNVPEALTLNQTVVIHLALSPTVPLQDIERHVTEEGALKNRRIRISKIMTADLKGSGFEIIPITESMQAINMDDITDWRWEVTALKPGSRHLHLTVNTIVEIDDQERIRTIHSHSELINIHVSMQQQISIFVAGNWKWLWSAIFVPFAGWIWESRKRRKK